MPYQRIKYWISYDNYMLSSVDYKITYIYIKKFLGPCSIVWKTAVRLSVQKGSSDIWWMCGIGTERIFSCNGKFKKKYVKIQENICVKMGHVLDLNLFFLGWHSAMIFFSTFLEVITIFFLSSCWNQKENNKLLVIFWVYFCSASVPLWEGEGR